MPFQKVEFEFPHEDEDDTSTGEIEIEPSSALEIGETEPDPEPEPPVVEPEPPTQPTPTGSIIPGTDGPHPRQPHRKSAAYTNEPSHIGTSCLSRLYLTASRWG